LFLAESPPFILHILSPVGNIFASLLRSLFQNTDKPPVFGFAVRLTLRNLDNITYTCLIMFIMNAEFGSALDVFAVFWMFDLAVNGNPDAFVAALAYYQTAFGFPSLHFLVPDIVRLPAPAA
jgi:hypothetical protein